MIRYALTIQGNRNTQMEPIDPLFIHPLDNPVQPLVSNIFNSKNFDNWKRFVIIVLFARNKLALIDGSPDTPDPNSPLFILWKRNSTMVLSCLLNSLNENINNSVLYFGTTKDLWKDLK